MGSRRFLAGDYAGSRQVLLETRGRTGKADKAYPVAVSDLHRAQHDGQPGRLPRFCAHVRVRGDPRTACGAEPDDPLILLQRLDTASQLVRDARIAAARQIYDDTISRAAKNGYFRVEAEAMFQVAALYVTLADINPDFRGAAAKRTGRLQRRREPQFA